MGMVDWDEEHFGHPPFDTPCSSCGSLVHSYTNIHVNGRPLCATCATRLSKPLIGRPPIEGPTPHAQKVEEEMRRAEEPFWEDWPELRNPVTRIVLSMARLLRGPRFPR